MADKKKIFAISGSTRKMSTNLQILQFIKKMYAGELDIRIYDQLETLPHFNPDLDTESPPQLVKKFRQEIEIAGGVIICTPEYVFSLPGSLKNAIEWTVSTTLFSELPVALITASGLGQKAHEALILVMETIFARTNPEIQLLITGARAKLNGDGIVTDEPTIENIRRLMHNFMTLLQDESVNTM